MAEEKEIKTKKRLIMDIDINIHCEAKKWASIRNITLTEWVKRAILKKIAEEKKYDKDL